MQDLSERGILIAVEGIDGAGKTTQVKMLFDALKLAGEAVTASKEPTNGPWGRVLRQSAITGRLSLAEELHTFIKDRTEHLSDLVLPALRTGSIVILDRYFYSTIAYQGARGANVKDVTEEMFRLFARPDITFILDVDPMTGIHRISHQRGEQPNHFEDSSNLAQARKIFESLGGAEIVRLDGALPIAMLHGRIIEALIDGPLKRKRCAKSEGCHNPLECVHALTNTCEWFNLRTRLLSSRNLAS